MTDTTVGPCPPKDEHPTGWAVLLALLADWGIALRLVLLVCVPMAAVVVIVALVVIYLGAVGVGALLTLGGGGYGTRRLLARRWRRRPREVDLLPRPAGDPRSQLYLGF
ncbi:MAG: hypothetical protein ACRDTA_07495 [Pseudonocardiaceae bacterium]